MKGEIKFRDGEPIKVEGFRIEVDGMPRMGSRYAELKHEELRRIPGEASFEIQVTRPDDEGALREFLEKVAPHDRDLLGEMFLGATGVCLMPDCDGTMIIREVRPGARGGLENWMLECLDCKAKWQLLGVDPESMKQTVTTMAIDEGEEGETDA